MTATTTLPATPIAKPSRSDGDRIILRDISWERYTELRDNPAQRQIRMTLFDGELTLMSPSRVHERLKELLAQFIRVWAEEQALPLSSAGSTTLRNPELMAALEPDSAFYLQHAPEMWGRDDFDPANDPPPDLAIEIDVSSSSLGRMSIYASLGVPEVWRTDGETLTVSVLCDGQYQTSSASLALTGLSVDVVMSFLNRRTEEDEIRLIREFRTWAAAQKPSAGSDA